MQARVHRQILRAGPNMQEEENKEICRGEWLQVSYIIDWSSKIDSFYFSRSRKLVSQKLCKGTCHGDKDCCKVRLNSDRREMSGNENNPEAI